MNHKKIILVGFISAFVAVLTSILGVAGTIIGSVVSSVLYNMLTEALERPVSDAKFSTNFEWEIAYIFPLAVIALIQLLLIFALLSDMGILPYGFHNAFMSLQEIANNNLYRILGIAMLVISVYPLVLKPDIVKKSHGAIIAFVGLIFLARGFADAGNILTNVYDGIFIHFDLPIAIIAFVLIAFVIFKILMSARESEREFNVIKHQINQETFTRENLQRTHHSRRHEDFDYEQKRKSIRVQMHEPMNHPKREADVRFKSDVDVEKPQAGINKSSANIHFESNDLLDDYKK